MAQDVYLRLRKRLNRLHVPVPETENVMRLLRLIYREEDADWISSFPAFPKNAAWFARKRGISVEDATARLNDMANRGLIVNCPENGEVVYLIMPLVPGSLEMQFVTGEVTDEKRAIAHAAERVLFDTDRTFVRGFPEKPIFRVIPVDRTIGGGSHVQPFEQAKDIIDRHDTFCVQTCYCRHEKDLIGTRECKHPKEVCMGFGGVATFLVQRGLARSITKEEAFEKLRMADEAGLVHLTDNAVGKTTFMCNCCGCCCGMLTVQTRLQERMPLAVSRWISAIDQATCNGCGMCVKRCHMSAIELRGEVKKDRKAFLTPERCIGCGLCEVACHKTHSIRMIEREHWTAPEDSYGDLVLGVALSRLPIPESVTKNIPGRGFLARRMNRLVGVDGLKEKIDRRG